MSATTINQVRTTHQFRPPTPKIGSFNPKTVSFNVKNQQICLKERILSRGNVFKLECCKWSLMAGLNTEEEDWVGIKKLNGKCKESVGMVELLECLEREAIMGEDQGKEPNDYNRRAMIFDKSSKVFQALKQTANVTLD